MIVVLALGILWGCGSGESSSTTPANAPVKEDQTGKTPSTGDGAKNETTRTD
jgi:hypothetical protein